MSWARLTRASVVVVSIAVSASACDKTGSETEKPGDSAALEAMEGKVGASTGQPAAGQPAGAQATDPKAALPTIRDRDPEEEKRKMATSRQQSAKARDALEKGTLDQAITLARAALRVHEQNVDAMLVIAEAYYKQSKYEIVQAVVSSGLAVDAKIRTPAETSQLYNLQGFAFLKMEKESLATQSFKQAAESDDKNAAAWNNLGTRYLEAGDIATAASCFSYAVELDKGFYKAHLNLGAAQRAQGKLQDAEKSMLAALKMRPSYPEAYFDLGILYLDADPFPSLDTTARLNKSIQYLEKYKSVSNANTAAKSKGSRGRNRMARSDAATHDIADDYIRVANKGLDREKRRIEREGRAAAQPTPTAATPDDGAEAAVGDDDDAGPAVTPQGPGAATPQGPGAATPQGPAAPKPQGPGAATPQGPGAATPQGPGAATPQGPGAAKPQGPATPTPTPTPAPKAPAPTPAPPPAAPQPQGPAAPAPSKPAAPAPQQPTPQPPKPQAPAAPAPQKPTPQKPASAMRTLPESSAPDFLRCAKEISMPRGTRDCGSTLTLHADAGPGFGSGTTWPSPLGGLASRPATLRGPIGSRLHQRRTGDLDALEVDDFALPPSGSTRSTRRS